MQAVREDLGWAQIEPRPGRYNWGATDALVRFVTKSGLVLLPILDGPPKWAAPTMSSLPATPAPYAAFVGAVVRRYGPGGMFWRENPKLRARPLRWFELWNEPYIVQENRSPAIYAHLVKAAVIAGRRANPATRFLIEGETFYDKPGGGQADWIDGMYTAVPDLGRYFDALAVHPYGGNPEVYTPANSDAQPGRLERAHDDLVAHGDGDKPLWVTEIGWSTCSEPGDCVTDDTQAEYLRHFLTLVSTKWRSFVKAVFVYDLRDVAPAPADDGQAHFGLLSADLAPKPAWYVLRFFATGTP